jgi:hypothetical protein
MGVPQHLTETTTTPTRRILPANSGTTHPSTVTIVVPSANAPAIFQRVAV